MAKDDQQEAFEKILTSNLARSIDFIKFAEGKNAALLTFNSAWILALSNILRSGTFFSPGFFVCGSISITLIAVSAFSSIISFIPKTAISYFARTNNRSRNLLFVGDIETLLTLDLKTSFLSRYKPLENNSITDEYIYDLSEQIGITSQIAMRKFRFFNRGAALTLLGLGILSLPYLAQAIRSLGVKFGT